MSEITYHFASKFTDCPGGRYRARSEKSGEEFRDDILIPLWTEHSRVIVDLNGVYGFPPSFLDEVFGALVDRFGRALFDQKLEIRLDDDPVAKRQLDSIIDKHSVKT